MNNVKAVLTNMNINTRSPISAVQSTKNYLERVGQIDGAVVIFKQVLDKQMTFENADRAAAQACCLIDIVVAKKCVFDNTDLIMKEVDERMVRLDENLKKLGLKTVKLTTVDKTESKKGKAPNPESKQQKVFNLYADLVVKNGMPNAEFVKHIVKEFGLTKLGARTYAYNARINHEKTTVVTE